MAGTVNIITDIADDGVARCKIEGNVTAATSKMFQDEIAAFVEKIIDMNNRLDHHATESKDDTNAVSSAIKIFKISCANLNYINSSGLRVFLVTYKQLAAHGVSLVVVNTSSDIKDAFLQTGLGKLFSVT